MKTIPIIAATLGLICIPVTAWAGPVWSLTEQPGTSVLISNNGRSRLNFTHGPNVGASSANNATVVLDQVKVASTARSNRPDAITHQNYLLLFRFTDLNHVSHLIYFSGYLTGTEWSGGASLTNHFTRSSVSFVDGKESYTISMESFVAPRGSSPGQFKALVSFHAVGNTPHPAAMEVAAPAPVGPPGSQPGNVSATPEPSSMLLGGVGLSVAGLGAWWRGRRGRRQSQTV